MFYCLELHQEVRFRTSKTVLSLQVVFLPTIFFLQFFFVSASVVSYVAFVSFVIVAFPRYLHLYFCRVASYVNQRNSAEKNISRHGLNIHKGQENIKYVHYSKINK